MLVYLEEKPFYFTKVITDTKENKLQMQPQVSDLDEKNIKIKRDQKNKRKKAIAIYLTSFCSIIVARSFTTWFFVFGFSTTISSLTISTKFFFLLSSIFTLPAFYVIEFFTTRFSTTWSSITRLFNTNGFNLSSFFICFQLLSSITFVFAGLPTFSLFF